MTEQTKAPVELLVPEDRAKNIVQLAQAFAKSIAEGLHTTATKLAEDDIAQASYDLLGAARGLAVYASLKAWSDAYNELAIQGPVKAAELSAVLGVMLGTVTLDGKQGDQFDQAYNHATTLVLAAELKNVNDQLAKQKFLQDIADANGITVDDMIRGAPGNIGPCLQTAYDKGVNVPVGLLKGFGVPLRYGINKDTGVIQPPSSECADEPLPVGPGSPPPSLSTGTPTPWAGANAGLAN